MQKHRERIMQMVFLLTACISIAAVALICIYLLGSGIPTIWKIGFSNFFGMTWRPRSGQFGIFPMIVGSVYVTAGAILVGVVVYVILVLALRTLTREDLEMMPGGKKLAKILHIQ